MKKLSILAAIAFAIAFTVPAFAQQNTIVNTFNFFGNVARSDHAFAWVSVIGPYINPTTSTPLIIHFVDGTQDFTCNITGPGHVNTQNNIIGTNGIASGTITVTASRLCQYAYRDAYYADWQHDLDVSAGKLRQYDMEHYREKHQCDVPMHAGLSI